MSGKRTYSRSATTAARGKAKPPTKGKTKSPPKDKTKSLPTAGPTLAPDWNLECDFVYSEYLRALVMQDIVIEEKKFQEEVIELQLAHQTELLRKAKLEDAKVVNEIEENKIQLEIAKLFAQLKPALTNIEELLQDYNVEENLKSYTKSLKNACDKLHLINVQAFATQQDYDTFSKLLEICTDSLRKLKNISNAGAAHVLCEHVSKYMELEKEVRIKLKMVSDLQSSVHYLIYKNASDKFAESEN